LETLNREREGIFAEIDLRHNYSCVQICDTVWFRETYKRTDKHKYHPYSVAGAKSEQHISCFELEK